ncbi:MAG TPA: NrpR regulatory domain-containing protein [Syntrophales bacterium]|nr:NrpR regulatory domain-containing protein [Syntrophales bacterium]HPO34746.1 NrpR regulatory domain-containing protein [Syntrophales bacterium]
MNGILNPEEIEKKTLLILKVLSESSEPVGSRIIARRMRDLGVAVSERSVRYYLKFMDLQGLTKLVDRHDGRMITDHGMTELSHARVKDKVGLSISRIESLAYRTTFDPAKRAGLIPINVSFMRVSDFPKALKLMGEVFSSGLAVSSLLAVAGEGERLGEVSVPPGMMGVATVCSIVVNGVLLKQGIPMDSKFGGILQMRRGVPLRFTELIHYSGSSLDPSEVFIRGNMTTVGEAVSKGEGTVLANFREIPAVCRLAADEVISRLREIGFDGVLKIGKPGESVCEVPVDLNKVGVVLAGGLNPVARVREAGIEVENRAMSTVMEYGELRPFEDFRQEYKKTKSKEVVQCQ